MTAFGGGYMNYQFNGGQCPNLMACSCTTNGTDNGNGSMDICAQQGGSGCVAAWNALNTCLENTPCTTCSSKTEGGNGGNGGNGVAGTDGAANKPSSDGQASDAKSDGSKSGDTKSKAKAKSDKASKAPKADSN